MQEWRQAVHLSRVVDLLLPLRTLRLNLMQEQSVGMALGMEMNLSLDVECLLGMEDKIQPIASSFRQCRTSVPMGHHPYSIQLHRWMRKRNRNLTTRAGQTPGLGPQRFKSNLHRH